MRNVLEWLEATAQVHPRKTAFADESTSVTFAELVERARSVGTFLAVRGCEGRPVALYMEKSVDAVAGLFGTVYARAFYSFIDIRQPQERFDKILETLDPALVLTDEANYEAAERLLGARGLELVRLEEILAGEVDDELLSALRVRSLDIDPLYVNFTSGSTGTPKGVAVSHRSVIDFIPQFTSLFGIGVDDQIGNQAPFDFDVSVKDIYSGISTGATVHMIPRGYFSVPVKLMDFLVEREITVCTWAVSALCFVSIMGGFEYRAPTTIRRVIFSGEVMPVRQLEVWKKYLPDARFVNVYGPTEVTCNCTYYVVDRAFDEDQTIPAGKPFPNEKVFLLDEDDREVTAPDTEGEICVSGTALALGYYNAPEKTAGAFVQNPLNRTCYERIYRTGDIGMYDAEGNLIYVTRKDHQIKHMGQRIELGEIEVAAQSLAGVTRACCLYDPKRKRIKLYYTGEGTREELHEGIAAKLPQYMVPNKVIHVDQMPMTKNGKIDRRALAAIKR